MNIAFVVDRFPHASVAFLIQQVAALRERGISVTVFSFTHGSEQAVAQEYHTHHMGELTRYLEVPRSWLLRWWRAFPKMVSMAWKNPRALVRVCNVRRYGKDALSLRLLYWAHGFLGATFDLAHCHFGPAANKFVLIREVLGLPQPFVTTFYGYDVSRVFHEQGPHVYDSLRAACALFFVMSHDMKRRLMERGFDPEKIEVGPPGIRVQEYAFRERCRGACVNIASVGRLIPKKGFDDLLRALDLVRRRSSIPIACTIIGDGPLRTELGCLTDSLNLNDIVTYTGYMSMEDINKKLYEMDVYIQSSKTDLSGNME